jgi:simple sugar transport system permease protein
MFGQVFNAHLLADAFGVSGTVLILAGLGYMFTDRAGVFNIAIEGLLLFSAFFAAVGSGVTGSVLVGIAAGIGASILVSMIFYFVSIGLRADIIVVGIAINLLASGVTVFLLNHWFGSQGVYQPSTLQAVPSLSLPGLDSLPALGALFTNQSILTYLAWLLVPFTHVLLYSTPLGLRLRSVGENPEAAATVGIKVRQTQFIAVMLCAILVGLAGCFLSIAPYPGFNRDMSAGQGWIALAAETLGRGTPVGTFASSVFFGGSVGLASNMKAANIGASQLVDATPYVVTIIGLAIAARRGFVRRTRRRPTRSRGATAPSTGAAAETVATTTA